jgi:DHA2 family multidrug resistance protein-like MFS transporter
VAGSLLTSALLKRMRPAYVMGLGFALGAVGLAVMAQAVGAHSLLLIVLGNVCFAIGTAPGVAIVSDLIVSAAPPERSGAASALSETASEFGGALGIALLGSFTTLLYRAALSETAPGDVAPAALETAMRGIGPASGLSPGSGALLSAAQSAYSSAVHTAFQSGAGIALLVSVIAVAMFRHLKQR